MENYVTHYFLKGFQMSNYNFLEFHSRIYKTEACAHEDLPDAVVLCTYDTWLPLTREEDSNSAIIHLHIVGLSLSL